MGLRPMGEEDRPSASATVSKNPDQERTAGVAWTGWIAQAGAPAR